MGHSCWGGKIWVHRSQGGGKIHKLQLWRGACFEYDRFSDFYRPLAINNDHSLISGWHNYIRDIPLEILRAYSRGLPIFSCVRVIVLFPGYPPSPYLSPYWICTQHSTCQRSRTLICDDMELPYIKDHTSNPWNKCPKRGLISTGGQIPIEKNYHSLVEGCDLVVSRMSSKVKVIGQRSRSSGWKKCDFQNFSWVNYTEPVCHDTWRHDVTVRRHDVMWRHGTTSWRLDILWRCSINGVMMAWWTVRIWQIFWNGIFVFSASLGCPKEFGVCDGNSKMVTYSAWMGLDRVTCTCLYIELHYSRSMGGHNTIPFPAVHVHPTVVDGNFQVFVHNCLHKVFWRSLHTFKLLSTETNWWKLVCTAMSKRSGMWT